MIEKTSSIQYDKFTKNKKHTVTNEVRLMIQQTVLPFKLEITRDTITSHAGL